MDNGTCQSVSTCSSDVFPSQYELLALRTPLCPIHSLPDDILSLIFDSREPLHSDQNSGVYDSLHTDDFPWVLSYVCRRWRALVLASPLLWSTIQFDMEEFIPSRLAPNVLNVLVGRITFLLGLSVQRSRKVDLRIEICDVRDTDGIEEERQTFIYRVMPFLLPTTSRWCHLDISGYPDFVEIFSIHSLKRLRSLEIFLFDEGRTLFSNVPQLTKLGWESVADIDLRLGGVRGIELPLSGIRFFSTPVDGLVHLSHMLQLEKLHVKCLGDETQDVLNRLTSEIDDLSSFVLPHLHTVTIQTLPAGRLIHQLFKRLSAPVLHTLKLRVENLVNPCLPEINGVNTLSPETHNSLSDDAAVTFISRMPSIDTLILGPHTATPAVMRAIGRRGILPKLCTLGVPVYSISVGAEDFVSLLEQRVRCDVALTALRLAKFDRWERGKPLSMDTIMKKAGIRERWEVVRDIIDIIYVDEF